MAQNFNSVMEAREAAAREYMQGRPEALLAISVEEGQSTFYDPMGGVTAGAVAVNNTNEHSAARFAPGGTTHFEILDQGAAGGIGFWTGFQHAEVCLADEDGKTSMTLRVTEIFRETESGWKLIHRHASRAR